MTFLIIGLFRLNPYICPTMANQKTKFASVVAVLMILSATCSGFLVGRTIRLHEEGKLEQTQQLGEQVVTAVTILNRGVEVVKRVALR